MKSKEVPSHNPAKDMKTKSHPFWRWFWLSFLVISIAYAGYSFYVPSNDVNWAEDMVSAQEMANESDKNIMLFFTGEWCTSCRIMKREIFANEEAMKAINSKVIPIIIDVDDPKMADIVNQYKIGVTPVTLFTDPEGNVLDYSVGKVEKEDFLQMLESVSK
jgi:protein disulfide-isomerase